MSHYTDEPRFTIEQIDLLQRLRRTGMTRHEILHALETLDRLDQEHSDKFGRRSSYGGGSYSNSTNNVPASSSTATASTQTQHSGMSPSPSNSYDTSPQPCTTNQNGRESNERLTAFNGKMSPTRYPLANSLAQRSYSFEASEEDLDIDDKVEELMRSVEVFVVWKVRVKSPPACRFLLWDYLSSDRCYQESRNCFDSYLPASFLVVSISVPLACLSVTCRQSLPMCRYSRGCFTVETFFPCCTKD